MPAEPPDRDTVFKAVDVYMQHAYGDQPTVAVRSALATLRTWSGKFYACPVFVKDASNPPAKYSMRLGNRYYPHMKLVVELAPDGQTFLFRADSHDRHCCPPEGNPEHTAFVDLMDKNQKISQAVESGWAEVGVTTFKTWLRDDLARRKGGGAS